MHDISETSYQASDVLKDFRAFLLRKNLTPSTLGEHLQAIR